MCVCFSLFKLSVLCDFFSLACVFFVSLNLKVSLKRILFFVLSEYVCQYHRCLKTVLLQSVKKGVVGFPVSQCLCDCTYMLPSILF